MNNTPSTSLIACTASPTSESTLSTAFTAAGITPVCPTMSGLAKLMIITSYLSDLIASTRSIPTSGALISGFKSYVATSLGLFTRRRASSIFGSSTPPLKKKVTCAYFSVSARRSCFLPFAARYSPNVFLISSFSKAISLLGIDSS